MLSLESVLSLFTLLALSSALFFFAKRVRVPYTVMLVLAGILIVPLVQLPYISNVFGFLDGLVLTPNLLFYIFLPILIFESAFNMNIRRMVDNIWSIGMLAIAGLLISSFLIAGAVYLLLPFVGIEVPFILALLFGAIISATDPVAVLSLFKEFGAPKRLTMIFEGESLFNDGTAVALFLVILTVIQTGYEGTSTIFSGIATLVMMIAFGVLFGLLMAGIFSRALSAVKSNEFVAATIMLISAHLTFILSEVLNEITIGGFDVYVSSIIATTVAALFLGNYSRHSLSSSADNYLGKVTEHFAFMANSLVFLLAGLLFASSDIDIATLLLPILLTILIVAAVRVIAVFSVTSAVNAFSIEEKIPRSWEILLSWGSLRGALAIIIVLLVPEDLVVAGWNNTYSPRDFLLALTVGCILATLFIKAPLIGTFIRKLNIKQPIPIVEAYEVDLGIYYLLTAKSRFMSQRKRGFVSDKESKILQKKIDFKLEAAQHSRTYMIEKYGRQIFVQSLHMTAIRIENHILKQLYANDEVNEIVYRRIRGKLNLQKEKIEYAQQDAIDPSKYIDRKDVFDRMVLSIQTIFIKPSDSDRLIEKVQYYRAQMIIARKVTKVLNDMQHEHPQPVFMTDVYDQVIERYISYRKQCSGRVDTLLDEHPDQLSDYMARLANRSLNSSGVRALNYLSNRGLLDSETNKDIEKKFSLDSSLSSK